MTSESKPASVTWLGVVVLIITAVLLAGFAAGLSLPVLPLSLPRQYLLLRNGIWGLGGIAAALSLFTGRKWAPALARGWAGTLAVWYWGERLLYARSMYAKHSWPAALGLTAIGLTWMLWVLSRPRTRIYFTERRP